MKSMIATGTRRRRWFRAACAFAIFTISACVPPGVNPYYARNPEGSKHIWPKGFRNAEVEESIKKSGLMVWLWHMLERDEKFAPERVAPRMDLIRHPDPAKVQVTWIGHATFLIQTGGMNILTDPMFSDYASPFPVTNLKRKAPPGVAMDQLPPIDIVVISHNHYDHLDAPSIRRLGAAPKYFVPLGLGKWMKAHGAKAVYEMDWEHTAKVSSEPGRPAAQMCVTSAPAQHFSGRGPLDRNQSLWSGWVLETGNARVYFAGDTGYMRKGGFRAFSARIRGVDVALVPIGAYHPEDQLRNVHAAPEEAVKIAREMRARYVFPMHWGTFRLTTEPMREPAVRFRAAAKAAGYDEKSAPVLMIGETYVATPEPKANPCGFDSMLSDRSGKTSSSAARPKGPMYSVPLPAVTKPKYAYTPSPDADF